jgi:hypothetical protein
MTDKEAMRLALWTLSEVQNEAFRLLKIGQRLYAEEKVWNTIITLKEQLAQPAQRTEQKPVVFYRCGGCGHAYEQVHPTSCDCMNAGGFDRVEYYTTPPAQPAPTYACHLDVEEGQKPDECVINTGKHHDCVYAKKYGDKGRDFCGEWKLITVQEPLAFAGLSITEIRLPKGMTSRFEGGVLIIEAAHGITKGGEA